MCLYPRLIKNRKYTPNKKNGGVIPTVIDDRVKYVPIGCGKCKECVKQKAREWQIRLLEDIKENTNGKFVTLTFSDESISQLQKEYNIPLTGYTFDNAIATKAVRLFLERYRRKYNKSLRHWLVTELGHNGTHNIHMHGIVWTDKSLDEIEERWQYGHIWKGKIQRGQLINYVNDKTVAYTVKYVSKIDKDHPNYKPIVLTSAGIGSNYMKNQDHKKNKYKGEYTDETYKTRTGHKISLPIYWRNKIYSDHEKEQLWLLKLDKEERWVWGERVSIKHNMNDYNKLVNYYRELNKELGYGTDQKTDEEALHYERQQRILRQKTRIAKAMKRTPSAVSIQKG